MHLRRRSHGVMVESMKGKNHADMREEGAMHEVLRMTKGRPVSRERLEGDVDAAVTAQAQGLAPLGLPSPASMRI